MVMAEANPVGTPDLAHRRLCATEEVLHDHAQLIAADDQGDVLKRMQDWWSNGRPVVRRQTAFDTERVVERWIAVFERRFSHRCAHLRLVG